MKKIACILFALFAAALVFPQDARACFCIVIGGETSAQSAFERADHVIIAKITGPVTKQKPLNTENILTPADILQSAGIAEMTVEKAYKGTLTPGEKFEMVHSSSSCDPVFDEKDIGREFLLYLVKERDLQETPLRFRWGTTCARSQETKSAAEDILYLDNLSSAKGRTRLSGTLWGDDAFRFSGMKVVIRQGSKTWETVADSNGEYEIYDLPTGEYEIKPELPKGWTINMPGNAPTADPGRSLTAVLSEGRHTSKHIHIIPDNAIRGQLLSPSGKPLSNAPIYVGISGKPGKDQTNAIDGGIYGQTDNNGEFDLRATREGEYVLYVTRLATAAITDKLFGGPQAEDLMKDFPSGTFYYPGVADIEKAKVFSIKPSTFFDGLVFQVPKSESLLKISATIHSDDGVKIANPIKTSLQFISISNSKEFYADSLENGVLHITIPKGARGYLSYSSSITEDNLRNCPEKPDEPFQPGIHTTELWIDGKEIDDDTDVKLRLPDPCLGPGASRKTYIHRVYL